MRYRLPRISDPPILWSIPFTLLILTTITSLLDWLTPFVNLNIENGTWTLITATLVTSIVTGIITETWAPDKQRVLTSMIGSSLIFSFLYNDIVNVLFSGLINLVYRSIPYPILSTAINTIILSFLPSLLVGLIIGAAICLIPKTPTLKENELTQIRSPFYDSPPTFEKICSQCGRIEPFEASYCSICGIELNRKKAPEPIYCMYCGSRINYFGKFCPDCGEEIDHVSRTWKYRSNQ